MNRRFKVSTICRKYKSDTNILTAVVCFPQWLFCFKCFTFESKIGN